MARTRLRMAAIRVGSIGRIFRDLGSRLVAPLPQILAATKSRIQATVSAVRGFLILPPQPVEGTCVVISELSARFLGTTFLAVALGLSPLLGLLLATVATLLSARHVVAGYFANRVLRETGELLGEFLSP